MCALRFAATERPNCHEEITERLHGMPISPQERPTQLGRAIGLGSRGTPRDRGPSCRLGQHPGCRQFSCPSSGSEPRLACKCQEGRRCLAIRRLPTACSEGNQVAKPAFTAHSTQCVEATRTYVDCQFGGTHQNLANSRKSRNEYGRAHVFSPDYEWNRSCTVQS